MPRAVEERIYTLDEIEAQLNEVLAGPCPPNDKKTGKVAIELHGRMARIKDHHDSNPDVPFDQDRFTALARRLMVEVFQIEGLSD